MIPHTKNKIDFRLLTPSDVTFTYVNGLNDTAINQYMGNSRLKVQTFESVQDYIRLNQQNENDYLFGIFVALELIGTVRLHDINQNTKVGQVGIALFDKNFWGKGIGISALNWLSQKAWNDMNLKKLVAGIHRKNQPSRKIFSAAGYVKQLSKTSTPNQEPFDIWILQRGMKGN